MWSKESDKLSVQLFSLGSATYLLKSTAGAFPDLLFRCLVTSVWHYLGIFLDSPVLNSFPGFYFFLLISFPDFATAKVHGRQISKDFLENIFILPFLFPQNFEDIAKSGLMSHKICTSPMYRTLAKLRYEALKAHRFNYCYFFRYK